MLEGLWLAVELTVWFDGLRSTLQKDQEEVEPIESQWVVNREWPANDFSIS